MECGETWLGYHTCQFSRTQGWRKAGKASLQYPPAKVRTGDEPGHIQWQRPTQRIGYAGLSPLPFSSHSPQIQEEKKMESIVSSTFPIL